MIRTTIIPVAASMMNLPTLVTLKGRANGEAPSRRDGDLAPCGSRDRLRTPDHKLHDIADLASPIRGHFTDSVERLNH
jgi:hypothetical protein